MTLISWTPNQTSLLALIWTQIVSLPLQKKGGVGRSIKQQNKTETVIEFKLSMNLVVFWSPGTKTHKHSAQGWACSAWACCAEIKSDWKVPFRKKREPMEILGSVVVQEAKAKIPDRYCCRLCSQGDIPDFCKIQFTGITLYLNGFKDLANIAGYTWNPTAFYTRWWEMSGNSPLKATELIICLFIDLLIPNKLFWV